MCRNTHPLFCLLPSIALDDVAFIVRYDAASHGHVIVVEIRADASCGLVGSCCECNKYGSGYGDALDVKVIIEDDTINKVLLNMKDMLEELSKDYGRYVKII